MKTKDELLLEELIREFEFVGSEQISGTTALSIIKRVFENHPPDQETESLREQLKRKEDEIDKLRVVGREWVDKIESQSELIESLAGALKKAPPHMEGTISKAIKDGWDHSLVNEAELQLQQTNEALLQYDNFKKKENGKESL